MLSSLMWPLAVVVVVVVFDKAVQLRKKKYVLSNCIIRKPCLFFVFKICLFFLPALAFNFRMKFWLLRFRKRAKQRGGGRLVAEACRERDMQP